MALDKKEVNLRALNAVRKFTNYDAEELMGYAVAYTIVEELNKETKLTSSDMQNILYIARECVYRVRENGVYAKSLLERLKVWYDNNFGKTYQDYIKSAEVHSYLARYCCRPMDKKSFRTIFGELLLAIRG